MLVHLGENRIFNYSQIQLAWGEAVVSRHAESTVEVFVHLVVATVFKTAEPYVNRAVGGFDSHTLPPFFLRVKFTCC